MTSPLPLVSIGLPIYNAEKTLSEAIDSILGQTYPHWELFLLDDGSADSSCEVAAGYTDARINLVADGKNRGISFRLNQAVGLAAGKYFCRMDADDLSFPDRLAEQVAYLEQHPDVDLVAASVLSFDREYRAAGVVGVAARHSDIVGKPWNGFHFPHPTWMGRLDWFHRHAYDSACDGAEDQALLFSAFRESRLGGLEKVLLAYRDDRRSLRKILGRRIAFWKAVGGVAWRQRQIGDLLLISLFQPLKMAADSLRGVLKLRRLRNVLQPMNAELAEKWERLLRQCSR